MQANIEDMLVLGGGGVFFLSVDVLFFSFVFEKKVGLSGGWIECTCKLVKTTDVGCVCNDGDCCAKDSPVSTGCQLMIIYHIHVPEVFARSPSGVTSLQMHVKVRIIRC